MLLNDALGCELRDQLADSGALHSQQTGEDSWVMTKRDMSMRSSVINIHLAQRCCREWETVTRCRTERLDEQHM